MKTSRLSAMVAPVCLLLLTACSETSHQPVIVIAGADPARGREAIVRYGCVACHAIPGIGNPGSNVGPPLRQFARRAYVGGVVPNMPTDLVAWLIDPPAIDPRTAMPNMGVTQADARDIAAYLYTLQ
ncbi:c-type cytochrome [Noviherbaspirillum sp. Root189]|uniref:c-type cytochrome n=1 Tax=Noviherbaspirillum sp. Root189 TaxID=1736487 RepID=UPI00070C055A|nr:c-type cytochrome [Noviherbaspirillum sp. Root189]KRB67960.1 cytochrome C [Noviherbaspirillum sp. Root189]